jgi:hypothetical protein
MFLNENALRLISKTGPPSGQSTTVTFTYEILNSDGKDSASTKSLLELRGIAMCSEHWAGAKRSFVKKEKAFQILASAPHPLANGAAVGSALHQLIYRWRDSGRPYKLGSSETARQIREVFRELLVEVIPYTFETADFCGRIRAQPVVSPVDSIHLACAAQARIDLFLTNDAALVGKIIPGIQFIAGLNSNLF